MEETKIICLTPTKNEDWIIERFLQSTSLWADHIIVLDQFSDDKTVEIAERFPKVKVVKNTSDKYDEQERQRILIEEARKIPGPKILIALDADESLTSNSLNSPEWNLIKKLEPGTVIKFDWVNLLPFKNVYWQGIYKMPFGYIDDGSEHSGPKIHSDRIPNKEDSPVYYPEEIKVMHFQYADWNRMKSKHRWYQCYEITNRKRGVISIYRQYHHMYSVPKKSFIEIPEHWLSHYTKNQIDYKNFESPEYYYWDYEVLDLIKKYGEKFFAKIDIWDLDWSKLDKEIKDPRTTFDKLLFKYLEKTQPYMTNIFFKIIDRIPRCFL